jgi:hypothetical protein
LSLDADGRRPSARERAGRRKVKWLEI